MNLRTSLHSFSPSSSSFSSSNLPTPSTSSFYPFPAPHCLFTVGVAGWLCLMGSHHHQRLMGYCSQRTPSLPRALHQTLSGKEEQPRKSIHPPSSATNKPMKEINEGQPRGFAVGGYGLLNFEMGQ